METEAPSSGPAPVTHKVSVRSSVIESIKGWSSLSGVQISKHDLRKKITMPQYLRLAVKDAIEFKDVEAGKRHYDVIKDGGGEGDVVVPEAPLVVFINSKSGGRYGPELKARLQDLMGQEQARWYKRKEYGGGGGSPQLTWLRHSLRHHTTTARHSPKQTNLP
ncbi:diacylglycerol kinase 4-like protein [Tanacetum coccineum]